MDIPLRVTILNFIIGAGGASPSDSWQTEPSLLEARKGDRLRDEELAVSLFGDIKDLPVCRGQARRKL